MIQSYRQLQIKKNSNYDPNESQDYYNYSNNRN